MEYFGGKMYILIYTYMKKLRDLNIEEELEIIEKIKTKKRKDIIVEYGISDRHYQNILKKHGIQLRERVQKYNFNENYFEKIDTEDKAYFLGFIVADGGVSRNNTLCITQKEIDVLEDFKKYIKFEGKIRKRTNINCYDIHLTSNKMIDDLLNLGIIPNKTNVVKYPNIPIEIESHFMRGLFDGDGCISIHKDKREGKGGDRGQVNICSGSKDFIEIYVDRLATYIGIKKNNIRCPRGTYYVIDWGGLSDVERIYNFFYENATVFLKRKKETFDKVMDIHSKKLKYRK